MAIGVAELEWQEGLRLRAAIARAGCLTEFADAGGVKLIRGNTVTTIDMSTENKGDEINRLLQEDDRIHVPGK